MNSKVNPYIYSNQQYTTNMTMKQFGEIDHHNQGGNSNGSPVTDSSFDNADKAKKTPHGFPMK